MIRTTRLSAVFAVVFALSACGGNTSFDSSNALASGGSAIPGTSPGTGSGTNNPDTSPTIPTSPTNSGVTQPGNNTDTPAATSDQASATVSWDIPTTRENGEALPLSDIGGYEILYRKAGELIFNSLTVTDHSQSEKLIEGLAPGRYEFLIAAFDIQGLYSDFSRPAVANIGS